MKVMRLIRKFVRFCAGFFFWLNALLIISIPKPSLDGLGLRIGLNPYETALIVFFAAMTLLSSYGLGKFLLDTLYVYFFPFILLYLIVKILFKVMLHIPRLLHKLVPPPADQTDWLTILKMFNPSIALPETGKIIPQSQVVPPTIDMNPQPTHKARTRIISFGQKIALPFTSFTVLWGMMIALTNKQWLLAISLGIVVFHTVRFIMRLAAIATGANTLFSGAENRLFTNMEELISKVMNKPLEDKVTDTDLAQTVTTLLACRAFAYLLLKRAEVTYAILALGCFIYAIIYLRLALLFGFVYLGVAKLRHLPLSFLDSMVNSLGMPLSYTFFPHEWMIQSVQLFHALVVIALGAGFINAYFKRKLGTFKEVAENVWEKLDQEQLKDRIYQFQSRFSQARSAGNHQ
jgi:hypothetical protein